MDEHIEILPALRSVRLQHVGCWKNLAIDFIPVLNIITGEGGSGKSTIIRAILHAIHASSTEHLLSCTSGYSKSSITVDLMSSKCTVQLDSYEEGLPVHSKNESRGESIFELLRSSLDRATPNVLLLFDDGILKSLDNRAYAEAVNLLNAAKCQIICVIPSSRIDPSDFITGRIYSCYWNDEEHIAKIKLLQPGKINTCLTMEDTDYVFRRQRCSGSRCCP